MKRTRKEALLDALFLIEDYIQTGYSRPTDARRRRLEEAERAFSQESPPPPDEVQRPGTAVGSTAGGLGGGTARRSSPQTGGPAGPPPYAEMPAHGRPTAPASAGPSESALPADDRPPDERRQELAALEERVRQCTKCPLHEGRTNAVPGAGVLDPLVMVIGEGPGADEDRLGRPFVGQAGKYLDKWLEAIEVSRESNAYIANIVKCRPPQNRDPETVEANACLHYLHEQIMLVRPKAILTVGRIAAGYLLETTAGIGTLRSSVYTYRGIPLVPTYHPSGVLRRPEYRRPVWEDLKLLRAVLDG